MLWHHTKGSQKVHSTHFTYAHFHPQALTLGKKATEKIWGGFAELPQAKNK